jgi:hypothetical protein
MNRKAALVWVIGILLCVLFVYEAMPMSGPLGHQWAMPITWRLVLVFSAICFGILAVTFLVARWLGKR